MKRTHLAAGLVICLGIGGIIFLIRDPLAIRIVLIAVAGLAGGLAARRLQHAPSLRNPLIRLRSQYGQSAFRITLAVGISAIFLSLVLLVQGLMTPQGALMAQTAHLSLANAFYFFGAIYMLAGFLAIRKAETTLQSAPFEQYDRYKAAYILSERNRSGLIDRLLTIYLDKDQYYDDAAGKPVSD